MRPRVRHILAVCLRNVAPGPGHVPSDLPGHVPGHVPGHSCGDLFVSLALCRPLTNLLYVSEIALGLADPDFAPFVMPACAPLEDDAVAIALWVRPPAAASWSCAVMVHLRLRHLVPVPRLPAPSYPPNSIILVVRGSPYLVPVQLPTGPTPSAPTPIPRVPSPLSLCSASPLPMTLAPPDSSLTGRSRSPSSHPLVSYNYDTLRALTTATRSLQELTASKLHLERRISRALARRSPPAPSQAVLPLLDSALAAQQHRNRLLLLKISAVKALINAAHAQINADHAHLSAVSVPRPVAHHTALLSQLRQAVLPALAAETRHRVRAIAAVFPIVPRGPLSFSIAGIPFPASIPLVLHACYARPPGPISHHHVNAALGYIAHVVSALVAVSPLRPFAHRILVRGSRSAIGGAPLYHDPAAAPVGPSNRPFERALAMLARTLALLRDPLLAQARAHVGTPPVDAVPPDCADNLLWSLHWLLVCVSAPP